MTENKEHFCGQCRWWGKVEGANYLNVEMCKNIQSVYYHNTRSDDIPACEHFELDLSGKNGSS